MVDIPLPSARTEPVTQPRASSTLVRVPGIFGAMVFGIACISLSFSGLLPFSTLAGRWAGTSLVGILTIALAASLIHAWTYAAIGAAAPRSGADYVLASRVLGAPAAFAASFAFVFFSVLYAGNLLVQIPGKLIPILFQSAGLVLHNNQLLTLAAQASEPFGTVLIGTAVAVIAFGLTILHPRTVSRILTASFVVVIIGWAIMFFQMGSASASSFPSTWDRVMGIASYGQSTALAQSLGMSSAPQPQLLFAGGILSGFMVFFGYFVATFFAGEVKQPGKSLIAGSWGSLLLAWVVFIAAALLLQRLAPATWIASQSYLYQAGNGDSMPWIVFYAAIMKPQAVLVYLVMIAWLFSFINLVQVFFFYCSRIILAWTKDRLIPAGLGYIHPNMRSPLIAILLVAIAAELSLLVAVQTDFNGNGTSFIFLAAAAQLTPVAAAILFPFRKRAWFETSPGIVRLRVYGIPVITITGVLSLLYLLAFLGLSFSPLAGAGRVQPKFAIAFVAVFTIGLIWYYARSRQMQGAGKDISSAFTSLPPE